MTADPQRTPDNHPRERSSDGGVLRDWWRNQGYRDVWLIAITALVLVAVKGNAGQTRDIQESRVVAAAYSCAKANETAESANAAWTTLQNLVVASVAVAGDEPIPAGEKDPFKWTGIKDGTLSRSVQERIPGYPDGTERLKRAQEQAKKLDANKVKLRNCKLEAETVQEPGVQ